MNLYLYISPILAHPPSCFKGFIFFITGEMLRYWTQNNHANFTVLLNNFIHRLTEWGHTIQTLTPILQEAASIIDAKDKTNIQQSETNTDKKALYMHWEHHPNGIKKSIICHHYTNTLKGIDKFDK